MKNIPASQYLEAIMAKNPPAEIVAAAKRHAARMEKIDMEIMMLKGSRRYIADWFLHETKECSKG